jgi:hypothetical protein
MLILANANHDVHQAVREGRISATAAIELVRKEGENAGAVIQEKSTAAGGGRVKKGDLKPKALPSKVVTEVTDALAWFKKEGLNRDQRKAITLAEKDPAQHGKVLIEIEAGTLAELTKAAALIEEARKQQDAKAAEKAAKASQSDIEDDSQAEAA